MIEGCMHLEPLIFLRKGNLVSVHFLGLTINFSKSSGRLQRPL